MNDATEFGLSLDATRNHLAARLGGETSELRQKRIADLLEGRRRIENVNICAVSFCMDGDLLSQWRGYSGEGHGYSIGFEASHLVGVGEAAGFLLGPCIYDSALQQKIISEIGDQVVEHISLDDPATVVNVAAALEEFLIQCGAFFKDPSFAEENEWRLVSEPKLYDDPKFGFRAGRSMLQPYYALDIGSLFDAIDEIVVGPCPHMKLAQAAVTGFLIKHDLRPAEKFGLFDTVRESKIPYRSW